MARIETPAEWKDRFASTLEVMLWIREQLRSGVPVVMFVGAEDVEKFDAFVNGVTLYRYVCGQEDAQWLAFTTWLRDERHEFPNGGWARKLLGDFNGDHLAAITHFLDRCEEFSQLGATSSSTRAR